MKEFIEKLIGRLEEYKNLDVCEYKCSECKEKYPNDDCPTEKRALDKAIEIVNQLAEEYKHCTLCYLQSPCEYQNENAILPNELLADKNGWISCSERLPEEKGDYLVTCNDGKVRVWWFVVEGDFRQWLSGVHQLKPIAWQPLPVPYQPKGE